MNNKAKYAEVYLQAFKESYPQLPIEHSIHLIQKAVDAALKDIRAVNIDSPAFKLTSKRLGIKHTYKAIREYLNQEGE